MSITLDGLLNDPDLYLHSYRNEFASFVKMDREHFSKSIFFDRRIQRPDEQIVDVPLDALMPAFLERRGGAPRINFIHHVAQCGSTLLARALDLVGRTRVVREPFHLRDLAIQAGVRESHDGARHDIWRDLMSFSLAQLSKRQSGESVIVKGNVPISMIAPYIDSMDVGMAGILLHFPLDDYLAAVLRTQNHAQWVEMVTGELRLSQHPLFGDLELVGAAHKAAALWLAMMLRYQAVQKQNGKMAALDANRLFDQPAETIAASAAHFDVKLGEGEAERIAQSDLFMTYGKNPEQPYDPGQRIVRREEAKKEFATAYAEAREWLLPKAEEAGLVTALANPLLGDETPLL